MVRVRVGDEPRRHMTALRAEHFLQVFGVVLGTAVKDQDFAGLRRDDKAHHLACRARRDQHELIAAEERARDHLGRAAVHTRTMGCRRRGRLHCRRAALARRCLRSADRILIDHRTAGSVALRRGSRGRRRSAALQHIGAHAARREGYQCQSQSRCAAN